MPARLLALALVALLCAATPAAAAGLRARTTDRPWSLESRDARPGPPCWPQDGRAVRLPAPLEELPLLARVGSLLPLLSPDVDTLAPYGERAPVVSLGERADRRVLLAFPRGLSTARLEDGLLTSREGSAHWRLSIRSSARRRWEVQASLRTLRRPFRPCAVSVRGGRLVGWRHSAATGVLRATLSTRRGRLTVRGCAHEPSGPGRG